MMGAAQQTPAHPAQAFGQSLEAFLQDAQATGMADGNHDGAPPDFDGRVAIGPMDI